MLWIKKGWGGDLSVRYQRIDVPAAPVKAETIFGSLSGYVGPTWAASCTSIQAAGRSAAECVT